MGFRYRKSIRLGGGFRINISGSGVGYSWGVPGYRITKTANGKIRQTASIPGTGLSYSTEESIYKSARKSALKEEPYTDTEVIQSTDRADYKDSDFKALMKRINRVCFLNKASFIVGAISLLAFIVLHTPQRLFLTILSFIIFLYAHYIAPVNLEYDFTDEQFDAYEEWYNAWRKLFAMYPKPTPTAAQKRMAVPRKPYPKKKLSECLHSPIFSEQMCLFFRPL